MAAGTKTGMLIVTRGGIFSNLEIYFVVSQEKIRQMAQSLEFFLSNIQSLPLRLRGV